MMSTLYGNLALLTFFIVQGHHALLRSLAASYASLPIGMGGVDASLARSVTEVLGIVFGIGEYDPGCIGRLADVDAVSAELDEAGYLGLLILGVEVQVKWALAPLVACGPDELDARERG